jgi:hypothetical protein
VNEDVDRTVLVQRVESNNYSVLSLRIEVNISNIKNTTRYR